MDLNTSDLELMSLIDNEQFNERVQCVRNELKELISQTNGVRGESQKLENSVSTGVSGLEQLLSKLGGMTELKDFAIDIVKNVGHLQQLEVVLTQTLGSASKAKETISMLSDVSLTSSFSIDDLTDSYMKLTNQGFVPSQEEMRNLCDLAGSMQNSLSNLLGGIVDAQNGEFESLQKLGIYALEEGDKIIFTFRGQKTAVENTQSSIREYILSLGDLQGIQGTCSALSETLTGRLTALQQILSLKMKEFGDKYKDVATLGADASILIIQHFDTIASTIVTLVTVYGSYRAMLIVTNALQKANGIIEATKAFFAHTAMLTRATQAQILFNKALGVNPMMKMLSIIFAIGSALYMFSKRVEEAKQAKEGLAKVDDIANEEFNKQASSIDRLQRVVTSATTSFGQKKDAIEALKGIIPGYNAKLDEEGNLIDNNTSAIKDYLVQLEKQIKLKAAEEELEELYRKKRLQEKEIKARQAVVQKSQSYIPDIIYGGDNGAEYARHMLKAAENAENSLKAANAELNNTKTLITELEQEIDITSQEAGSRVSVKTHIPKNISTADNKVENQKNNADQLFQLQQKNKQDEIDLIADEAERKRTQILFDYDKEYALILKEEKKLRELQGGKLTEEQSAEMTKRYSNASVRRDNSTAEVEKELEKVRKEKEEAERAKAHAEKQSYNDYYKAYGDYSEKKKAILSDYDDKIAKAETAGEKAMLGKERQNDLRELDRSMIEQTALWTNLFSDAGEQTSGFIQKSIADAEQLMQYLAGVEGVEIPVGIDEDSLEALKKDPEQIKRIIEGLKGQRDALNQRNPFMALIQGFKDLQDAANNTDLSKATKDQKLASGTQSIISGMQGVSSVLGEVGGALDSMGSKSSETFNGVAEVVGKTASMASTGASIGGPWGAAAGAAIGLATSLTSVFAKSHDNKREKEIEKLQDQIEVLDKAYDKLGETIEKSYSKDASNLIGQQNQMLEQQKVLIQGQIREEQDKKKADSGRIEEWQQQIEEINNTIAQNKVKAQDAIFGADVKSAIDEFAQAYADAWAAGNDRAKAMKDVVKNMIKGVIVEMLKSDFAPTVQKIRDRIESMLSDGIISSYEQLELDKMIEAEAAKADQKYAWADEYMKGDEKETSQESSKGGFESMSQDSADELNGRFTALQIAGEELKFQSGQQSAYLLGMSVNLDVVKLYTQGIAVSVSEMKDIALTSMNHLSTIEKNTRQLYQMNERLGNIERNTKGL